MSTILSLLHKPLPLQVREVMPNLWAQSQPWGVCLAREPKVTATHEAALHLRSIITRTLAAHGGLCHSGRTPG